MKTFKVNKDIKIECDQKTTSYGFKHEARLMVNGYEQGFAKACYYNRTWESFEYESVIKYLLRKTDVLTKRQKTIFLKKAKGEYNREVKENFGMIATLAELGKLFTDDQKEQNDWKTRMIKAGLGEGIIMPEDWDILNEDDKQARLDAVINEMKK